MNVVLTRERGWNEAQRAWLPDDAVVAEVPLTTTRYLEPADVSATLRSSADFGSYRALVITSARSARYVAMAREALRDDASLLSVGASTAAALDGQVVDVVGVGGAIDLAPAIDEGPVLLLGALAMRDDFANVLESKGIAFTKVSCYETVPATLSEEEQRTLRDADVVFIGAPSTWAVAEEHVAEDTWVVVPGESTAAVVQHAHPRVVKGWGPHLREHLLAL